MGDDDIAAASKHAWKKLLKDVVKNAAFKELENSTKSKTKEVQFDELRMSDYLEQNRRTSLSKLIFSIRSKTIDIKEYQPWKYETLTASHNNKRQQTIE